MAKKKKSNKLQIAFFKKFVFFVGFLNGAWVSLGFNPSKEAVGLIQPLFNYLSPWLILLFGILPTLLLILMITLAFMKARWFGILAILTGFMAGLLILYAPYISVVLLALGYILGMTGLKR